MKYCILLSFIFSSFYGTTQSWIPALTCFDSPYFSFQNDQQKYGVMDRDSNIVVPAVYNFVHLNRTPLDACAIVDSLAILVTDTSQIGINLHSLKRTKSHRFINIINNHIYYHDSVQWGAYDSNMSQILHSMKGTPGVVEGSDISFTLLEFGSEWYDYYQGEQIEESKMWLQKLPNPVKLDKNIICFRVDEFPEYDTEQDLLKYLNWRKKHPLDYPPESLYGLINLSNGKIKKAGYHLIVPARYKDQFYYWCVRFEKLINPDRMHPATGYMDVYDSNLNKTKRMNIDQSPFDWSFAMNQIIMRDNDSNFLIQVNQNGKTSCYLPNGKENISKKDSISYAYQGFYKTWENGKAKLLNSNGDQILKGEYFEIKSPFYNFPRLIVKTDSSANSWCIVDLDGVQSHNNCERIWYYNGWSGYEFPMESLKSLSPPKLRCIKNNKYHVIIDTTLIPLDSTNYQFESPTAVISNYLINKSGDVLLDFTYVRYRQIQDKFYIGSIDNVSIIASIDGKKFLKIEKTFNIRIIENNKIEVTYKDGSIKYFDPIEWKWFDN